MKTKVNVLGTNYTIRKVSHGQDEYMVRMHFGGYCDGTSKEIVLLDLATVPNEGWNTTPKEVIKARENETLRHELIHAFLNESGLGWNTFTHDGAWAKNEEMVDWIAIQFPKISKVFIELGCEV